MLGKLLKYDFKSVFKFWWIGAVSAFVLSLISGGCITVLRAERELPAVVDASAIIVIVISVISLIAFFLLATILVFVRFYKNFFTDEGYLTFTLPVKVSTLFNSKLIMGLTVTFATLLSLGISVFSMLGIGFADKIFTKEFWEYIVTIWQDLVYEFGWYLAVYALEGIIIFVLVELFTHLFLYCCITLASVITKKARIITAIGIYYGVNCVISFVMQLFFMFSIEGLAQRLAAIPDSSFCPVIALVLFEVMAFVFVVCTLLYTLQYYMLDRKLNLS